jgi:hypothetical protein
VKKRSTGLFSPTCWESGWLRDGSWAAVPVERKLTRAELFDAYRLWVKHADIREGRVKP